MADPLFMQIHQAQTRLNQLQQQIQQLQQQAHRTQPREVTQAAEHVAPKPATPTPPAVAGVAGAGRVAQARQAQPQAQQTPQPRVIRRAIPHVSTVVLPRRVMQPIAGQPPTIWESLLTALLICVELVFVVATPLAAIAIVLLGTAGTLLSALLQPALPVFLGVSTAIVLALLFVAWLALLFDVVSQFRTLWQALGTSTRAIRNRGASSALPPHDQRNSGGIANALAHEPADGSRETKPLPEGSVAGVGAGAAQQRTPGVVGYGERVEAAQWETRAKVDPNDPVEDTDQLALPAEKYRGRWAIIGSSHIGRSHEYDGKYREDSMAGAIVGAWQIVAVADGGGSYDLARIGAREATQAAVAAMRWRIERRGGSIPARQEARTFIAEALAAGIRAGIRAIGDEVARRNQQGQQVSKRDLRTTLLLLLHGESRRPKGHWVGGIQVGDGIIVARDGKGALHWLGAPDTGPTGNEVLFLTDVPNSDEEWERRSRIAFIEDELLYCLAMTDGVSDDFLPIDKNLGALEKPLAGDVLRKRSPHEAARALEALIDYERSGSFDDRTLVCIYKAG
jgi:hypothetical protein